MLLSGDYCQAISPASENSNTHLNHHPNIDHRGYTHRYTHIHNDPIPNSDNHINQYSHHLTSFHPDLYLYINIYLNIKLYIDLYSHSQFYSHATTYLDLHRYTSTY